MTSVVRISDSDIVHCSLPVRGTSSPDVIINGLNWSLVSHPNIPHLQPTGDTCTAHAAPMSKGSSTVFVNGLSAGRIGASILSCTCTASGSPSVFCGG